MRSIAEAGSSSCSGEGQISELEEVQGGSSVGGCSANARVMDRRGTTVALDTCFCAPG